MVFDVFFADFVGCSEYMSDVVMKVLSLFGEQEAAFPDVIRNAIHPNVIRYTSPSPSSIICQHHRHHQFHHQHLF